MTYLMVVEFLGLQLVMALLTEGTIKHKVGCDLYLKSATEFEARTDKRALLTVSNAYKDTSELRVILC